MPRLPKLLQALMFRADLGIVESGGGGAVAEEETPEEQAEGADEQQDDDTQAEGEPGDETEGKTEEAPEATGSAADEEVTVTIGDAAPPADPKDDQPAPEWVRKLRQERRELQRTLRAKDAEIQRLKGGGEAAPVAADPGPEPTLESCDFDAETFAGKLKEWVKRKADAEAEATKRRDMEAKAQAEWNGRLQTYEKAKTALKVRDMDEAEEVAREALNVVQQGVILNGAENPALVVYALGKNPKKAQELAAIADPVKFAFAVAKLETQLKVQPRKTAPPPERTLSSSVPGATGQPADLKRLEDEARRTGDYTKVLDFKRRQKAKQAA
jgi:hypothetical protein